MESDMEKNKAKSMSISKRITLFVIAILFVCLSVIGTLAYSLERREVLDANSQRALAIARTIAAAIDSQQFVNIMETLEPNDYYYEFNDFLDETTTRCDIMYLYIVDKHYDTELVYFAEGIPESEREEAPTEELGFTEHIDVYPDEIFETINTGVDTTTDIYDLGGFGEMVSAFAAIHDADDNVVGVVGIDLSVDDAIGTANRFGFLMIISIVVICISAAFFTAWFVTVYISRPIHEMEKAADLLARGNCDFDVKKRRNDEIGNLAEAFIRMRDSANEQSQLIERLADGDLTVDVHPRGDGDTVNIALAKMTSGLNKIMQEVQASIKQMSISSRQVADGSQVVASGSTEQAASVQQLSAAFQMLLESITHNAKSAEKSATLSDNVRHNAEKGTAQMQRMVQAVNEISRASEGISKVMKIIDDIASQTNILALNAAVEATRAGVHGKGFAVVTEEVRSLAARSARAAKDSEQLISDSIEKAALGAQIALETSESLREIVSGIDESADIAVEIARTGNEQVSSVGEINKAITQVSDVARHNSASAEASAAASQQMSGQSEVLQTLIERFHLRQYEW